MKEKVITLDVREDIRSGRAPFDTIMAAVAGLRANESLRLITPFEPVPLFGLLARQGFQHKATPIAASDWEVIVTREPGGKPTATQPVVQPSCRGDIVDCPPEIVDLDARGLEPPQPLVRILETLSTLPVDAELRARTDRRPMHLYSQLEERGFTSTTQEQSDGSFITHICRG